MRKGLTSRLVGRNPLRFSGQGWNALSGRHNPEKQFLKADDFHSVAGQGKPTTSELKREVKNRETDPSLLGRERQV